MIYHYRIYRNKHNKEFVDFEVQSNRKSKPKIDNIFNQIIKEKNWNEFDCKLELSYKSEE